MKNNLFIKVVCLIIAFTLVFTVVGCGEKASESSPSTTGTSAETSGQKAADSITAEKPPLYTIKLISAPRKIQTSDETVVGKLIKDKFSVVLEYIPYTGDLREKQNLMLAAGDYPEIVELQRDDMVMKYIQAGALVALDDYLPDSQNFVDRYKDVMPYWRLAAQDGKLYKWELMTPQDSRVWVENTDVLVRTDALEKQGWPNLVSEDDYISFLKKSLQDIPETNGKKTIGLTVSFAEPWGIQGISGVMYEKSDKHTAAAGNEGVIWNTKDSKYEDYFKNGYVRESVRFFNRLYREGLLDKECFTDFGAQTQEKLNNGTPLTVWYETWLMDTANAELQKAGHPEQQYIKMPIRSNSQVQNNEKRAMRVETSRPFNSVAITKNAKDPKRIMEMVNYFASDEGQLLAQGGVEGVHYKRENGKRVPTEEYLANRNNEEYSSKQGIGIFTIFGAPLQLASDGQPYDLAFDPELKDKLGLTDRQKDAFKQLGWANSFDYWLKNGVEAPTGIVSSIMLDPNTELGRLQAKMVEFRVKNTAKLIVTPKSDEEFASMYDNFIKDYEKMNPEKVVDKYNEMYGEKQSILDGFKK